MSLTHLAKRTETSMVHPPVLPTIIHISSLSSGLRCVNKPRSEATRTRPTGSNVTTGSPRMIKPPPTTPLRVHMRCAAWTPPWRGALHYCTVATHGPADAGCAGRAPARVEWIGCHVVVPGYGAVGAVRVVVTVTVGQVHVIRWHWWEVVHAAHGMWMRRHPTQVSVVA